MIRFQWRWFILWAVALFAASALPCLAKTVTPHGVHIAQLQYRAGKKWVNVPPGPLYVLQDTQVLFRVVPSGGKWHRVTPRWSGVAGAKRHNAECRVTFSRQARHRGDFQMLTVAAANRVCVLVLVYDLEPMMMPDENFEGRSMTEFGIGEDVWLTVKVTPFVPVAKLGGLEWSIDRFPGEASVIDFGARDGTGLLTVGADETFTVRAKLLSGPSQGQTCDILMNADLKSGQPIIEPSEREFLVDFAKIDAACRTMKLAELERVGTAMEAKWRSRDAAHYLSLVNRLSDLFDSVDFGNDQRFALAQRFALLALPVAKKSAPGGAVQVLGHLLRDIEYDNGSARGTAWSRLRREKVTRWLDAIQKTTRSIDRKFNPKDMNDWPASSVLPAEVIIPGMASEGVKDPKARVAYEAAVAENDHKAARLEQQITARRNLDSLWKLGENYIVRAYAKPPYDLAELRLLLGQYNVEWSRAQRIVRRVAAKPNAKK